MKYFTIFTNNNTICRHGIDIIGFSSDGDCRLLSAMKSRINFDLTPNIDSIKRLNSSPICVQDTIHIGTKLRNRLLNSSIALYIGTKVASTTHIKALLSSVPKEVHALVQSDIFPEDRQNYKSLEKIMDNRVLNAMITHVADSEATVMYLEICKLITSSFTKTNLKPIERLHRIWYATYFLRCWRKWILSENEYSLAENFISSNAYTCVEINAHALVAIIVKLRYSQQQNLFQPSFFASQPCEEVFRMMRSMGTINYTKINFALNELFHMIARVEIMNKTVYSNNEIIFPRVKLNEAESSADFPSDEEIKNAMENARKTAIEKAAQFGIYFTANEITLTELQFRQVADISIENESELEFVEESTLANELERNTQDNTAELFVDVVDADGSTRKIRKSTLIWMLSERNEKLSSDRLKRVQGSTDAKLTKKFKSNLWGESSNSSGNILKSDELKIGEWALFKINEESIPTSSRDVIARINGHLIGTVLGFRYIDANSSKQFKVNYVSTVGQEENKNIGILAIFYSCENGHLKLCCHNQTAGHRKRFDES